MENWMMVTFWETSWRIFWNSMFYFEIKTLCILKLLVMRISMYCRISKFNWKTYLINWKQFQFWIMNSHFDCEYCILIVEFVGRVPLRRVTKMFLFRTWQNVFWNTHQQNENWNSIIFWANYTDVYFSSKFKTNSLEYLNSMV